MIRAILFDLDGVLVDATELHYVALNQALEIFGCSIYRDEHESIFNGLPTGEKLRILVEQGRVLERDCKEIYDLKQEFTKESLFELCRPDVEKISMLDWLSRQGIRLAVCSNAARKSVDLMLTLSAIDQYFEFTLSSKDVLEPKPSPEIYLQAMNRLCLDPEECLIVEDSEIGLQAANRSGAHVIQVSDVHEVRSELFGELDIFPCSVGRDASESLPTGRPVSDNVIPFRPRQ